MAIFSLFQCNQSNRIDARIGDRTVKITTILTVRAMLTSKKKYSGEGARNKSEGKKQKPGGNAPYAPRWRCACERPVWRFSCYYFLFFIFLPKIRVKLISVPQIFFCSPPQSRYSGAGPAPSIQYFYVFGLLSTVPILFFKQYHHNTASASSITDLSNY